MDTRSWKLITADEATILTKSAFDSVVVEDGESNGCFPDPPSAYESNGFEMFGEPDDLLNQLTAPETSPGCRRR
jgi:hypothetical protein